MMDKWISVKDSLPDGIGVHVLAVNGDGIRVAYVDGVDYRGDADWRGVHDTCGCCYNFDDQVTHWMPLPELPGDGK